MAARTKGHHQVAAGYHHQDDDDGDEVSVPENDQRYVLSEKRICANRLGLNQMPVGDQKALFYPVRGQSI